MRPTPNHRAERSRLLTGPLGTGPADGNNGCFLLRRRGHPDLWVIVSDGGGWDHVSVTVDANPRRCPTWDEMCLLKELFFTDEETVLQLHPPKSQYVNDHEYCLHLWRQQDATVPLPPSWMVGPGTGQQRARELVRLAAAHREHSPLEDAP